MNPIQGSASDAILKTFLKANAFLGETDRFRRLDRLEAYYRGLQHDHKRHDWDGNSLDLSPMFAGSVASMTPIMPGYVQIRFRRPDVKFPLNRQVVRRFTDLLFSHTRKPQFEVEDDADTEDYLSTLINASNFFRQIKRARNHGGAMGSACVIFYFQNGKPTFRAINPKFCTPVWADEDARELQALKIEYKVPREEFQKESGKPKTIWYVYRRLITDQSDTIWPLTPIHEQKGLAEFDDEKASTVIHGYGFCPAEWAYNVEDDDNDYDGAPDADGTYDLMDAIDILWSQANKGTKSNMDP
ncbi:MAG: phage portal protein, partial [Gemmatimonadaceae bacterium]